MNTLLLATGRTQQTTTAAIQAQVSPACITDSDLQIKRCSIGQGSPLLPTEQAAVTAFVNTLLLATGRTQQTTTAAIQAQVSPACIMKCSCTCHSMLPLAIGETQGTSAQLPFRCESA